MKAIALAALVFAASMAPCVGASYDDLNAGIAYWNKEEWDSAISRFDKAIAAGDLNTDLMRVAYFDRGIAHQRRSETDKTIADLSSALAMRPSHVETLIALASAYADANQPEKAVAALTSAQQQNPKNNAIVFEAGLVLWQLGRYDDANPMFNRVTEESRNPYAWLWLQLTNLKLKRPLTAPRSAEPDEHAWPQPVMALYKGDRTEEEIYKAVEEAGDLDGQTCEANFYAGEWRLLHADTPGARAMLQKAAADCPKDYPEYLMAKFEMGKLP